MGDGVLGQRLRLESDVGRGVEAGSLGAEGGGEGIEAVGGEIGEGAACKLGADAAEIFGDLLEEVVLGEAGLVY